jgi:hypothetical protein
MHDVRVVKEAVEAVPALVRAAVHDELEQRAFDTGTVTRDVIQQIVDKMGTTLSQQIVQRLGGQDAPAEHPGDDVEGRDGVRTWLVRGAVRRVPEDFRFDTKLPARRLFELYCLGDAQTQIAPYNSLESIDLVSSKEKKRLSDMQALLEPVKQSLTDRGLWMRKPSIAQVHEMWREGEGVIRADNQTPKGKRRRTKQLAWTTQLSQFRKRARIAGDDDNDDAHE